MQPLTPEPCEIWPNEIEPKEIEPEEIEPEEIEPEEIERDRGELDRREPKQREPDQREPVARPPDPREMVRTTVYLPRSAVAGARAIAVRQGVSSAAIIRSAVEGAVGSYRPPPRGGFL